MDRTRKILSKWYHELTSIKQPWFFSPSEGDIFLVSYPRSGSTWLRVMLAELIYGGSGESLNDVNYFIPVIDLKPFKNRVIKSDLHVIKTEDIFKVTSKYYKNKKIIYLVRDPRDVVLSWFRFQKAKGYKHDFEQFFVDWLMGRIWPTSWMLHVNSWTGVGIEKYKIDPMIIKYEDLLQNPEIELENLSNFIGLNISQDDLIRAINNASVENMKKKEIRGLWSSAQSKNMQFIGSATNNQWIDKLSPIQHKLLLDYAEKEMDRFNYKKLSN